MRKISVYFSPPPGGSPAPGDGQQLSRRFRAAVATAISLLLALTGAIGLAAPASAAVQNEVGEYGYFRNQLTFWGTMSFDGCTALCLDPVLTSPEHLPEYGGSMVCGETIDGVPDEIAQLAYLIAKYTGTEDTETAVTLSQIARAAYYDDVPITYPDRYAEMQAEAEANGGTKAVYLELDPDTLTLTYALVRPGETDLATAHFFPGYDAAIEIETPNAVFENETANLRFTTEDGPTTIQLTAKRPIDSDDPVTVQAWAHGLESSCYQRYDFAEHQQRIATPMNVTAWKEVTGDGAVPMDLTVHSEVHERWIDEPEKRTPAVQMCDDVWLEFADGTDKRWLNQRGTPYPVNVEVGTYLFHLPEPGDETFDYIEEMWPRGWDAEYRPMPDYYPSWDILVSSSRGVDGGEFFADLWGWGFGRDGCVAVDVNRDGAVSAHGFHEFLYRPTSCGFDPPADG